MLYLKSSGFQHVHACLICVWWKLSPGEQGTSRGGADIQEIVKRLSLWGVNMLFVGVLSSAHS